MIDDPQTIFYLDHTARLSGGEVALLRTLAALDRTRVNPVVILAEDGPFAERLRQRGIEVQVLSLSGSLREVHKGSLGLGLFKQLGGVFVLFRYAAAVARLARARRASLLHTNSLKSDIYGALAGRMAGIPVVWHVRDHIDPSYLPASAVWLFRLLARTLPAFVLSNSLSAERSLRLLAAARKAVVYDGLEADELAEFAPRTEIAPETELAFGQRSWRNGTAQAAPISIGITGRLTSWKGQHVFIRGGGPVACVRLFGPLPGDRLPIVWRDGPRGEPPLAGRGARHQGVRGVPGVPCGPSSGMRQLDILVHASVIPEPFGQVVIEGMAAGPPVIATDGGGVQEIIRQGETGILVPMSDPALLASALQRLIEDPAEVGRRHVTETFTARQTVARLEVIYDMLLVTSSRPFFPLSESL